MRKKENNNLILLTIGGSKKKYFTSLTRAGVYVGLAAQSVKSAIANNSILKNNNNEDITFKIVDGSEIPYKLINN